MRKVLVIVFLALVLLGVVWLAFERGYPRARAGGVPTVVIQATCGPYPGTLEGGNWVKVVEYLEWSGCVDGECWSVWTNQGPSCLMEYVPHRCQRNQSEPDNRCPSVPSNTPPNIIYDPRAECDGEPAAGTWHHNAFARPVWDILTDPSDPYESIAVCAWKIDRSRQYWNFAETDECKVCVTPTPEPVPPLPFPTNTPGPTVCFTTPMPTPPPSPPAPTPFVPNAPAFSPQAYVHSTHDPKRGVYLRDKTVWNWQEFLHLSLSAEVTEPSQPGCSASTDVYAYWFEGSCWQYHGCTETQIVCPVGGSEDENCRWRPVYDGSIGPYVNPTLALPEWIHLIWTKGRPSPNLPGATWNFYPVGPVRANVLYRVVALTTYECGGFTYTAPWVSNRLEFQVLQLRAVRTSK